MLPSMRELPQQRQHIWIFVLVLVLVVASCLVLLLTPQHTTTTFRCNGFCNGPFYRYHRPPAGGTVVYGTTQSPRGANIVDLLLDPSRATHDVVAATWDSCLTEHADVDLGEARWMVSECTRVPNLANGDESKDGRSTTIHLDARSRWSDGTPITADDYLFYYAVLEDPAVGGAPYPYDTATLTKIDTQTLRYDWHMVDGQGLPTGYASYLAHLTPPLHVYSGGGAWRLFEQCRVVSAHDLSACYDPAQFQRILGDTAFHTHPIVPGAYQVQTYSGDTPTEITMVANPAYYSNYFPSTVLDRLVFRTAASTDALIRAFQSGQYTEADGLTRGDLPKIRGSASNIETYVTLSNGTTGLLLNQRTAAPNAQDDGGMSIFSDAHVRHAFFEALDRCTYFRKLSDGDCTAQLPSTLEYAHVGSFATYPPYNPADALALMQQRGFRLSDGVLYYPHSTHPVTLTLFVAGIDATRAILLRSLTTNWHDNLKIAIKTVVDPHLAGLWNQKGTLARGTYDMALTDFPDSINTDQVASTFQGTHTPSAAQPSGQNVSGVNDVTIDALLDTQRGELDVNARSDTLHRIFARIASEDAVLPLMFLNNIALVDERLMNYFPNPNSFGNAWNISEWGLSTPTATPTS